MGNYASVNGLKMYYETHGSGGTPLIMLHGGLSTIDVDFGRILPSLAKNRQIIAIEQQAHGHTADIDRPLSIKQMTMDTAALLDQIGVKDADVFGYSVGGEIALHLAIHRPDLVHKLIGVSITYTVAGMHPGVLEGIGNLKPEYMVGTPFQQAYAREAPKPEDWPHLIEKVKQMDQNLKDLPAEDIRGIQAPTLLIIGDSDIVRPEHAVEMFRLLGGGVAGDNVGLPRCQLAVLPGTTHITIMERADWLVSMVEKFLELPMPEKG